jgi:hypothetical protein
MQLPNGATRDHTQPSSGSTVVVKNPRKAGLPAIRPLAGYDAAQGFTWLTFAILAGTHKQIAGVNMGYRSFIYIDHRDRPWLMRISVSSSGWAIEVVRRFGLFGSDSVSWLTNQVIYDGDLGYSGTQLLNGDDVCQNHDGSSVLLNMRFASSVAGTLGKLVRVVDLQITSTDGVAGNSGTILFTVAHPELITPDDVSESGYQQTGTQPEGPACDSFLVTSQSYSADEMPYSYCGEGNYAIGTYHTNGHVSTVSRWVDKSWDSTEYEYESRKIKAYYAHDNSLHILDFRYERTKNQSDVTTCNAALSYSLEKTTTVAPNGETDQYDRPCSDYAQTSYAIERVSHANSTFNRTISTHYTGGLYLNGQKIIGWECNQSLWYWSTSDIDGDYSYSDSYSEEDEYIAPPEYHQILYAIVDAYVGQILSAVGTSTYDADDGGESSTVIEGETFVDPDNSATAITYPITNAYLRPYANNIFALQYGTDPAADNHMGVWSLMANGEKAIEGKLTDYTFYATVNPVDGEVTIDQDEAVCYV